MTVYTIFLVVGLAALLLTALRYFKARPSNWVVCFLQNFVGALFIFSGFVKAVDPLGTSYKMHEYFEAFAQEGGRALWEYLANFSTPFAIIMIAAELFVGFMLLIGWKPRFTIAIIWWLTLFFTLLTGYTFLSGYGITKLFILSSTVVLIFFASLALTENQRTRKQLLIASFVSLIALLVIGKFTSLFFTIPFAEAKMKVTDCGCFGDFIKLKPWETFYKDIILDIMIFVLVLSTSQIKRVFTGTINTVLVASTAIASLALCWYSTYENEPPIDFRPYAIGNNIPELRKVKKEAVVEMVFVYRSNKTGENKEFSYDDVMKGKMDYAEYDSMIERKDKVLDPGIPAKITNLRIENEEGLDLTDSIFAYPGYSLMVVAYNLKKSTEAGFAPLNKLATIAAESKVPFFGVCLNDGGVEAFKERNLIKYEFYSADETPLKTILRSNPGLVLLKNGVVVNKWHYKHLPTADELKSYFR